MSAWVKCSERMPECDQTSDGDPYFISYTALVYPGMELAIRSRLRDSSCADWNEDRDRDQFLHGITHWQTLPAPPE